MVCLLSGCSSEDDEAQKYLDSINGNTAAIERENWNGTAALSNTEGIDIDLTQLSSTMVYGEVYQMMFYPEEYVGKIIKMSGEFFTYTNPENGDQYFTVVVADALACCQQGLEFLLPDGVYPQDYPYVGQYVTVEGEFESYREYGYINFRLKDAKWS